MFHGSGPDREPSHPTLPPIPQTVGTKKSKGRPGLPSSQVGRGPWALEKKVGAGWGRGSWPLVTAFTSGQANWYNSP